MSNSTKTNKTFENNVKTIYNYFQKQVGDNVVKLNYSDAKSQPYCGFDDFSINIKKSSYNVYMNENNAKLCSETVDGLKVEINASDTTKKQLRCKLIRFSDYTTLKKCIDAIVKNRFEPVQNAQ